MSYLKEHYTISYNDRQIGIYYVYEDSVRFVTSWGCPWDIEEQLRELGLDKDKERKRAFKPFSELIKEENRIAGRKRIIYQDGPLTLERIPNETDERFSVYRRWAEKGDPDYSPLAHDAKHYEGPHTPEDMREWASWYAFVKMDDGTYEAALDEAWWWGGSHNDGGTIHREIPEEWFQLSYDEFLENVVTLAAAAHYGFTPEILKEREGLKEFFGFEES